VLTVGILKVFTFLVGWMSGQSAKMIYG